MDNINFLEEVGLSEVSRKTHIETKFLRYMVNKEFGKLNRINTIGFAKILRREYGLDLDSWLEEFNAYWQDKGSLHVKQNVSVVQDIPEKKRSFKGVIFLLLLAMVCAIGWYFKADKYILSLINPSANQVNQEMKQDEQVDNVEDSEFIDNELNEPIEDVNDVRVVELNSTDDENETQMVIDINDTNISDIITEDENISIEENNTTVDEEKDDEGGDEIYLQPIKKIWVGIVDLQTRKRTQYTTSKVITIDLKKPQIIITGHGSFTLMYESGKEIVPNSRRTMYYYIDGGTITSINKKEFITYNGGRSW